MKHAVISGLGLLAVAAAPAMAADIPVKAPIMAPVVAAAYNWTGCHIGGNVGGKWVRTSGDATVAAAGIGAAGTVLFANTNSSSFIVGGQVGCDYQAPGTNWVFGIEGDFDWQRWSRTNTLVGAQPFPFVANDTFSLRSRWEASLRGRVGYAWDRWMIYGTGGVAFTDVEATSVFVAFPTALVVFPAAVASERKTLIGPTVGAGFEYAFTNNWSFGLEGRYTWYGTKTFNQGTLATVFTPATGAFTFAAATQTAKVETFEVLAKLNFKFF